MAECLMQAMQEFRDAIRSAGLIPPDMIEPGKFHKFPGEGKRNGNTAAWCKLFPDGVGGIFGDYSTGLSTSWQARRETPYTLAEREAFKRHIAEAKAQAEAERKAKQAEAARKAAAIWQGAQPAPTDHAYLTRKGIQVHGARQHNDALVIPMRTSGEMHSLQFIDADGDKRFLTGGRVIGCYYSIGVTKGAAALCIAEGFATSATIHEATGYPVAVAFNAGNLESVALALRAKLPELRLILCADDDAATEGNPGLTKAAAAARSVGGLVAVPDFGADRPEGATDFNDMAQRSGLEAVKQAIASARVPARSEVHLGAGDAPIGDSAGGIAYRRASDIQSKPIHWLWRGRIARGKVSMLAGNPGLGKSQVTSSMAAVVTTGGAWPVDRARCELGNVVFLSAEDDPADTIRPRLEAAGADLARVFILDAVVEGYRADGGEVRRAFNLTKDLARLDELLVKIGDVALIVIDPITAYLGDADSHKNAEIRALLSPLSDLAAKHGAAVVCVSHLNKGGSGEALMRVTGSLAFVAAARSAWLVAKDSENEARRLFLPLKNNIGNDQTGLAFSVQSAQVKSPAGLIETSRVSWEAEAVTVTADEVMTPQGDSEERSAVDDAKQFLADLLADGPVRAGQIKKDADGAGLNWRTVHRAADRLGVQRRKEGMTGGWLWNLAPKMTNNAEGDTQRTVASSGRAVTFGGGAAPVEVEI
jgi:putative DNA primase/helicase